jgi:hypothetical protein
MRCSDLALQEYETLVRSLDPNSVPPSTPRSSSPSDILHTTPNLTTSPNTVSPPLSTPKSSSGETISNLLQGQKGVHQLFVDYQSALSAKEKSLHVAQARIDELVHTFETLKQQLHDETSIRVAAESERDKALRDDGSAARVVERYMTFTQKTHATVHMHLENLRSRSNATITSLRAEVSSLRIALKGEVERNRKLRYAMEEVSEGFSRESAGRRREVGLRLGMLAFEEKRERKVEVWLDRVRRARDGAEGAVLEPDMLEVLLDEGVEAIAVEGRGAGKMERQKGWKGMLGKKKGVRETVNADGREESSLMRVLLAEELVDTLVKDLQVETERRMELERQRVEWLASDAVGGVKTALDQEADSGQGQIMFDLEDHEEPPAVPDTAARDDIPQVAVAKDAVDLMGDSDEEEEEDQLTSASIAPPEPSPVLDNSPLIAILQEVINPLTSRYTPLQTSLHDLSSSLSSLRTSLPVPSTPSTTSPIKKGTFRNLSLKTSPTSDPALITILDSIHEVIEDARVDLEIAVADIERVYRGFEALLGVGGNGAVQGSEVLRDAREYAEEKEKEGETGSFRRLEKKVGDLEHDIVLLKRTVHEVEGMDLSDIDITGQDEGQEKKKNPRTIWHGIKLRTITITPPSPIFGQTVNTDSRRRTTSLLSSVGSVGRSFSSTVVGTPRRAVSGFTGGLYKGKKGKANGKAEAEEETLMMRDDGLNGEEDDVE